MNSYIEITLNIITVVRNDEQGILKTLESISTLALKNTNVKINNFIQDGLSNDNTLIFLKKFIDKNTAKNLHIFTKSEEDSGIFDAMNRATERAIENFEDDDLILYLNAGDVISREFLSPSLSEILINFKKNNSIIACFRSKNIIDDITYFMPPLSIKDNLTFQNWIKRNTPVHQAMIFKFKNRYPIHYPLCFQNQADSLLFFYLIRYFGNCMFYDYTICDFELGGNSGNYRSIRKVINQFYEQFFLILLRQQSVGYIFLYIVNFASKYIIHNIFGDYFIKIHATINRLLRK